METVKWCLYCVSYCNLGIMAFKPKGKFRKRKLSDGQEDLERFCGKGDVMNLSENARCVNKVRFL